MKCKLNFNQQEIITRGLLCQYLLLIGFMFSMVTNNGFAQSMLNQLQYQSSVNQAINLILSDEIDYERRITTAKNIFANDINNQETRQLFLRFYSSIVSETNTGEFPAASPPLNDQLKNMAARIDQGHFQSVKSLVEEYASNNDSIHPALSVIALQANDMKNAYLACIHDLEDRKISAFTLHFLGILSARETRFVEAEKFFQQASGKQNNSIFQRWLNLYEIQIHLLQGKYQQADFIINGLFQKNPSDVWAMYYKASMWENRKQRDAALQELYKIRDLLYPDPHLIAKVAWLAIKLNAINEASQILESFENLVEPFREFYEVFSRLRRHQNRFDEEQKYLRKANLIADSRVQVFHLSEEVLKWIQEDQKKRAQSIIGLKGIDPLNKIYLLLLEKNSTSAINHLQQLLNTSDAGAAEYFLLANILRRTNQLNGALGIYQSLTEKFPEFQPYKILSYKADLANRVGKQDLATTFYSDLLKRYPESSQADVAQRFIKLKSNPDLVSVLDVSPLFQRYPTYSAPFVLSEILNYWGDTRYADRPATFPSISAKLGTSAFNGLNFNQSISALNLGTQRYLVEPFSGLSDVLIEYLEQKIPVIFFQGEMFADQSLSDFLVISGADKTRKIFYAEGITPYDSRILTESELIEGICVAVYPESGSEKFSSKAQDAQIAGAEYNNLNAAASFMQRDPQYDDTTFLNRIRTMMNESNRVFIPHQMAFNRWIRIQQSPQEARKHLNAIQKTCSTTSLFWYLSAWISFKENKYEEGLISLEKALQKQPENLVYLVTKVIANKNLGRTEEAIELSEKLRFHFPEEPLISIQLLELYQKTGDQERFYREKQRIENLFPGIEINIKIDTSPTSTSGQEQVSANKASS